MSKENISGIYGITNKTNNKKYVGSSKSVHHRWNQSHRPLLRKSKHGNQHLQNSWNKYGEEQFEFSVLEECDESNLQAREGHWIEEFKSWHRLNVYNLERIVNGRITRHDYELHESIVKLFEEGMSKLSIAKDLGVSRTLIYSCLEQNDLHKNTGRGNEVKLTDEVREKVETLRGEGKSWDEIIGEVGVSKTQLYREKAIVPDGKFTHPKRKTYKTVTPDAIKKLHQFIEQGKSWTEIEVELGVSRNAFWQNGIKPKAVGRKVPQSMTEEKKTEIRQLRREGKTWKEVCAITGVSYTNVRNHKLNEN